MLLDARRRCHVADVVNAARVLPLLRVCRNGANIDGAGEHNVR